MALMIKEITINRNGRRLKATYFYVASRVA